MNTRTLKVLEYHVIKDMLSKLCQSSLGKEMAAELYPSTEPEEVKQRLRETTEAYLAIVRRGSAPLGGIWDIRPVLKKAEIGAVLSPGELLKIADTLRASRTMKKYSEDAPQNQQLEIIDGLIDGLVSNKTVEDSINNAIISEEEISDSASEALRAIRRQVNETNNSIKDKLQHIIHSATYQKYLQDNLVTMRDGRYVVPVKQEHRNDVAGLVHDSSASGATLFIEPMAVVEANNKLKELKIKERIEIERILTKLTELVVSNLDILNSNVEILAQLDFIFAKGRLSLDLKAVEPKVNTNGYVKLKKARHPLIDPSRVVPIDIELGNDFSTLVITGPNTGGKTVSLKTVGLFTAMAQSGLHLPAYEGSEISVFSKIFADIGDEQSIEQNLSTFSAHMTNIANIVKEADGSSLCLFDELGAGTDPTEGAALAISILGHLKNVGAKTIATTHYSEIKVFALSNEGFENASCEFDVETLRPTYRILMGVPGKSNAFDISKRIGLDERIIETARGMISKESVRLEDVIGSLQKDKEIAERERQRAEEYRKESESLKNDIQIQRKELEDNRQKILLKARQEALGILEEAKDEADETVKEFRQLLRVEEEKERERLIQDSKSRLKGRIGRAGDEIAKLSMRRTDDNKPPKSVKPGDSVHVVSIDQTGEVLTAPDKDGNLQVRVGILKINSNLKDLRLEKEEKVTFKREISEKSASVKSLGIQTELDLRGQLLDDAIINTDKYLDDSSLSGLKQVTIIHGKGTGALRSGIHKFLKGHPHVRTFRLGHFGEGEMGVTIVELK